MNPRRLKLFWPLFLVLVIVGFTAVPASAKDNGYDAVVNHLRSRYRAKKQGIPFLGLARFAVKLIKPAGVKSFNITLFENLRFESPERGRELQQILPDLLKDGWSPLVRVSQLNGDQSYVYGRDDGNDIKLMIVNIEADNAAVIRVKLSPERLVEFLHDPKILGIPVR